MLLLSHCATSATTSFSFLKYNLSYNFKMVFTIFNPINPNPINATHYLFIYFHHIIILFFSNFSLIFLTFNFFYKYFHLLQPFSLPYLFISPLPSTLISLFIFPFIFSYFVFSYSHYFIINLSFFSILYIVFFH